MKRLYISVALVCLVAMLLPACAPAPEPEPESAPESVFDQAAEETAIRHAVQQTYSALNDRNLETFFPLFDENYENWAGTMKGLAAWEKWIKEYLEHQKDVQWNFLDEIGIIFVTPDVAIFKDQHELIGSVDADGKKLPIQKRMWASVWAKRNGKWLMTTQFVRVIEE